MQDTWVQSPGGEIPWTEQPGGAVAKVDTTE